MPIGNARSSKLVKSDTKYVSGLSSLSNEKAVYYTEHLSNASSCLNHKLIVQTATGPEVPKSSRKNATGDSITCKVSDTGNQGKKNIKQAKFQSFGGVMTSHDKQPSFLSQLKGKVPMFSWLFHRTKKKSKPQLSTKTIESEDLSQLLKEWGVFSLEMLKNELQEVNEKRNLTLMEIAEMRSSLGELQHKLLSFESYCEELRMALKQENLGKDSPVSSKSKRTKQKSSIGSSKDDPMPVSHEVMVEDFIQIVSEVRISVNHFCKTLISLIDETGCNLMEKLSVLLRQNLTPDKKNSKEVLCYLEALVNQYLYQDFENCIFQKNGSPKVLDPQQNRLENFSAFISFRNMSWNDILRKGFKYYSKDFSLFCDQKMSSIVSFLNWWRPWPELLLQSFFVSAKNIWLLHLLALSFNPPAMIFRVDENRRFDPLYMEDVLRDKWQPEENSAQVKVMVMPGFHVKDRVFRCRVICEHVAS